MLGQRRTDLASPKAVPLLPFKLDRIPAAVIFNGRFVRTLKSRLPGYAEALAKIPDVHIFLFTKPLSDSRMDAFEDLSRVGNGGLAARRGCRFAKEVQTKWQFNRIRVFVMGKDFLLRWVVSRGVNSVADFMARRRPLAIRH